MNVLLQPCASDTAKKHFRDTVERPVSLEVIRQYVPTPPERCARDGATMVWGLTPGADGSTVTSWLRLENGDSAAFYAQKKVFFVGRICTTIRNADLARRLWRQLPDGQTWELIYFMDEGEYADIPLGELTRSLRYRSDKVLRAAGQPEHRGSQGPLSAGVGIS